MTYSIWLISTIKGRRPLRMFAYRSLERKEQAEYLAQVWTAECRQYPSLNDMHYEAREDVPTKRKAKA